MVIDNKKFNYSLKTKFPIKALLSLEIDMAWVQTNNEQGPWLPLLPPSAPTPVKTNSKKDVKVTIENKEPQLDVDAVQVYTFPEQSWMVFGYDKGRGLEAPNALRLFNTSKGLQANYVTLPPTGVLYSGGTLSEKIATADNGLNYCTFSMMGFPAGIYPCELYFNAAKTEGLEDKGRIDPKSVFTETGLRKPLLPPKPTLPPDLTFSIMLQHGGQVYASDEFPHDGPLPLERPSLSDKQQQPKQPTPPRTIQREFGPWKMLKHTNVLGNVKEFDYGDKNQLLSETSPPVDKYNNTGNYTPNTKLVTKYGYGLTTKEIGIVSPDGGTLGKIYNGGDELEQVIDEDGVTNTINIWNLLGYLTDFIDDRGMKYSLEVNPGGQVLSYLPPYLNNDPKPKYFQYAENGMNDYMETVLEDGTPCITLTNFDPKKRVIATVMPEGTPLTEYVYGFDYSANQNFEAVFYNDGTNTSTRSDWFHMPVSETGVTNSKRAFLYDYKKQLIQQQGSGGNVGEWVRPVIEVWNTPWGNIEVCAQEVLPMPPQLINFNWYAGRLVYVQDISSEQETYIDYTLADQKEKSYTYSTESGSQTLLGFQYDVFDSLNRKYMCCDSPSIFRFGYDGRSNRIMNEGWLYGAGGWKDVLTSSVSYNSFTPGNKVIVSNGVQNGDTIEINDIQGTSYTYNAGKTQELLRQTETQILPFYGAVTDSISYTGERQLFETANSLKADTSRTYNGSLQQIHFVQDDRGAPKPPYNNSMRWQELTVPEGGLDLNGNLHKQQQDNVEWRPYEEYDHLWTNDTTTLVYDSSWSRPVSQTTDYWSLQYKGDDKGTPKGLLRDPETAHDNLTISYVEACKQFAKYSVSGTRSDKNGTSSISTATKYYSPVNGLLPEPSAILGEYKNGVKQGTDCFFKRNYAGDIIERINSKRVSSNGFFDFPVDQLTYQRYFYALDLANSYLASYESPSEIGPFPGGNAKSVTNPNQLAKHLNNDVWFGGGNGRIGKKGVLRLENETKAIGIDAPSITSLFKDSVKDEFDGKDFAPNNSLEDRIPNPSVNTVVVGYGESWKSLASKAGLPSELGELIQKYNCQDSEQAQLVQGQIIEIPQIIPINKTATTGIPLGELMARIVKPLQPYMKTPQAKHHWYNIVIQIIAVGVAVMVTDGAAASSAPWLTDLADNLGMKGELDAVARMVSLTMGALIDAGGQLVTGMPSGYFNWDDVLNSAVIAGTTTGLNLQAGKALNTLQTQVQNSIMLSTEQQFTLMAEGLGHFDMGAVLRSAGTAGISDKLDSNVIGTTPNIANEVMEDVDEEGAGFVVNGFTGNIESDIIQDVSGLVGDQLGGLFEDDLNHLYASNTNPTEKSTYVSPNSKLPSTKNLMQQEYNKEMRQANLPTSSWSKKTTSTVENRYRHFQGKKSGSITHNVNTTPYKPSVPMTKEQQMGVIVNAIYGGHNLDVLPFVPSNKSSIPSIPKFPTTSISSQNLPILPSSYGQSYFVDGIGIGHGVSQQQITDESKMLYGVGISAVNGGIGLLNGGISLLNEFKRFNPIDLAMNYQLDAINKFYPQSSQSSFMRGFDFLSQPTPYLSYLPYSNLEERIGGDTFGIVSTLSGVGELSLFGLKSVGMFAGSYSSIFNSANDSGILNRLGTINTNMSSELDPFIVKQIGKIISENPVAMRSYSQVKKIGTDIILDFTNDHEELGITFGRQNRIEIYMRNNANVKEAVSTLIHETVHMQRFSRGFTSATQYEEYLAFRREYLFNNGVRPSLSERQMIWNEVQQLYSHLPSYKVPVLSWN